MGLITYLVIKFIGVAHDNEWAYLATGWGAWFLFEMFVGVVLPLVLFAYAIRHQVATLARWGGAFTVFGIVLNRLNTALITFNWQLYQEIPHIFEFIVAVTLFMVYVATYRFILYRLPILYSWKTVPQEALAPEAVKAAPVNTTEASANAVYRKID